MQKQLLTQRPERILRWMSLGIAGFILFLLIFPMTVPAEAEELTDGQSEDQALTSAVVHVQSAISLALTNRIDLDVVPKSTGTFSSSSAKLAVSTNNTTGYGIFMNTVDGSQNLSRAGGQTDEVILPVAGQVSSDGFQANTWGYKLTGVDDGEVLYQAVPGTTTKVKNITTKNNIATSDNFDLSLGVNVNHQLPSGTYQNGIMVSVVANPRELVPFEELTYMQEMDAEVCQNASVGDTRQLIDIRDGKKYWVSKMADGKCWMNQNLALDLDETQSLTPALSDVSAEWVPKTTLEGALQFPSDYRNNSATYSWNLGNAVLATPTRGVACADVGTSSGIGKTLADCSDFQIVDETWTYAPAAEGTWNSYEGVVAANATDKTYDSHYLVGNYYQLNTATAGTGGTLYGATAPDSICPKGWALPTYQQAGAQLAGYGITNRVTGTVDGVTYDITLAPLYYVRGGALYNAADMSWGVVGHDGDYRLSSTSSHSTYSYYLMLSSSSVDYARNDFPRAVGMSVRCIAR